MEKQQPSSSAVHVDTIMRDKDEERLTKFAPTVLIKGDYVGHPFRGNQWTDASGASRGSASAGDADLDEASTLEELGLETISDSQAAKIGENLRRRNAAFIAAGGTISAPFEDQDDAIEADDSRNEQAGEMDEDADPDSEQIKGMRMTATAIGEFEEDGYIAVRAAKSSDGEIAGAVAYTREPVMPLGVDPVESGGRIIMEAMGSMNTVRGAGTAMFMEVLRHAARTNSGITLEALDEDAYKFWRGVGFDDPIGEGVLGLTADSVKKLLKAAS